MIKTNRDIKSSLDAARKSRAVSFTQILEEKMKAELEKEFGPAMSEGERSQIAEKGKVIKARQSLALNKSRMKMLKAKEKAKTMQEARCGPAQIKPESLLKKKIKSPESRPNFTNFKKIDIEY